MKKMSELFTLVLLVLMLQACSAIQYAAPALAPGDVIPVQPLTAIRGMQQVVQEAPSTFVMAKDGLNMFAWPIRQIGWAWTVLDTNKQDFLSQWKYVAEAKGNFCQSCDMDTLVKGLEDAGWVKIAVADLSANVVTAIKNATSWIAAREVVPVFLFVGPGFDFTDPDWIPGRVVTKQ